jgi:hypothetical protein
MIADSTESVVQPRFFRGLIATVRGVIAVANFSKRKPLGRLGQG